MVKKRKQYVQKPRYMMDITGDITKDLYLSILGRLSDFLENKDAYSGISLIINSCGGNVSYALSLYDMFRSLNVNIRTIVLGECQSSATILFALGNVRLISENSLYMIHSTFLHYESKILPSNTKYFTNMLDHFNGKAQKIVFHEGIAEEFISKAKDAMENEKEFMITAPDVVSYGIATGFYKNINQII